MPRQTHDGQQLNPNKKSRNVKIQIRQDISRWGPTGFAQTLVDDSQIPFIFALVSCNVNLLHPLPLRCRPPLRHHLPTGSSQHPSFTAKYHATIENTKKSQLRRQSLHSVGSRRNPVETIPRVGYLMQWRTDAQVRFYWSPKDSDKRHCWVVPGWIGVDVKQITLLGTRMWLTVFNLFVFPGKKYIYKCKRQPFAYKQHLSSPLEVVFRH